ncbi:sugar-binding protein [Pseudomonas savastanoi pv. fraxini]|nr:sugar-binding protein [Pseudomonas savastanoi pv. fraxini]
MYNSVDRSTYFYSAIGKLIKVSNPDGGNVTLNYVVGSSSTRIQLSDEYENIVELEEDSRHQLLSMKSKDFMVNYTYNSSGMLSRVAKSNGGVEMVRSYKYESPSSDKFLTGILNERGIVYASGEYDSLGRAVSSKHANESQKTEITYGTGYSTVINSLGRKSIYHYDVIGGIQKITSIEGEPTPNCPYSNSTYTYNDRGLVLTKTDAKGLITTYEYNDRGFEISRTEASGTTLARTTTTEWDPDRFLPIRVIEPNRVTVYSYDNQGRELTRQSTSR